MKNYVFTNEIKLPKGFISQNWKTFHQKNQYIKLQNFSVENELEDNIKLKYRSLEHIINSLGDTLEDYSTLIDLDKLKYAVYITKIINDVTTENQNNYKILQLYLNTLYTISETDKNLDLILAIFKLRLMCILGFKPQVEKCTNCSIDEDIKYFSLKDNGFKCSSCGKSDKSSIEIMPVTVDAIKYITLAPAKKIFSFNVPENSIKELEIISKLYLNEKLEKEYKLEDLFKK